MNRLSLTFSFCLQHLALFVYNNFAHYFILIFSNYVSFYFSVLPQFSLIYSSSPLFFAASLPADARRLLPGTFFHHITHHRKNSTHVIQVGFVFFTIIGLCLFKLGDYSFSARTNYQQMMGLQMALALIFFVGFVVTEFKQDLQFENGTNGLKETQAPARINRQGSQRISQFCIQYIRFNRHLVPESCCLL